MLRFKVAALTCCLVLVGAAAPAAAVSSASGPAAGDRASLIPVRQACDANGRCYETGDSGFRDEDDAPPRRRFDTDDDRPPPPRRRYDPDDDDRLPPLRRFDRDDD